MAAKIGGRIDTRIIAIPISEKCALKNGTFPNIYPANKNRIIQDTPPIIL